MKFVDDKENILVHFIDVSHGEAVFIEASCGSNILIDGGSNQSVTGYKLNRYLTSIGVSQIDLVAATHPHEDHIGGLTEVLSVFPVGKVISPAIDFESESYRRFLAEIKRNDITQYNPVRGDEILLDSLQINILHPAQDRLYSNTNNFSLVMGIEHEGLAFLFTGDIEKEAELELALQYDLSQFEILKVPHHGSNTSSHPKFLEKVDPKIAVFTVGENDFEFPSTDVVVRYDKMGIKTYRTDINGNVVMNWDGKTLEISVERVNPSEKNLSDNEII